MYKITAVKGSVDTLQSGSYSNISGGTTHLENIALPFTQTISKTVNRADIVTLSFFHNNSATSSPFSIKLEIWVNNKVVKTQTFEGTTSLNEAIVYVFQ